MVRFGVLATSVGVLVGLVAIPACDLEVTPPLPGSTTAQDSGKYDCSKYNGYKKLCPNDPTPSQSPRALCDDRVNHPKCGDLGAKIMECLWSLQTRKDMCGADGVTIPGKVTSACGVANDADEDCRARSP